MHENLWIEPALAAISQGMLSARLDTKGVAKLLGFPDHAIAVLTQQGLLKPLGNPSQNAPKYYCTVEVLGLAVDRAWLHKASREVSKHWNAKNSRRRSPVSATPDVDELVSDPTTFCFTGSV